MFPCFQANKTPLATNKGASPLKKTNTTSIQKSKKDKSLYDWLMEDTKVGRTDNAGEDSAATLLQRSLKTNLEQKYAQTQSLYKSVSGSLNNQKTEREQLESSMKDVTLLVELLMQELSSNNNNVTNVSVAVQTLEEVEQKQQQQQEEHKDTESGVSVHDLRLEELEEEILAEQIKTAHLEALNTELRVALEDVLLENKELVRRKLLYSFACIKTQPPVSV
jgi:hypothetical protein